MFSFLIRNAQARQLIEYFWISAVVTIFAIRIFLYVSGYPQLGGESLHIAHMLWGGLLMGIANIVMLAFLNRSIKMAGAIIGGIGFGTFIDELGKFLTHDNNYFFQPTILLLYLLFVGLFFLAKQIEIWFPLDKQEYLINSLELLKDVALEDLDSQEKKSALEYLKKVQANNHLEAVLINTFNAIEPLPTRTDPFWIRATKWARGFYHTLVANMLFAKVMVVVFVLGSVDNFTVLFFPDLLVVEVSEWGVVISTLISLFFILQAAYFFRKHRRLLAFESLKTATLVSIFLIQLFLFYIEQLSAAVELFGAIISLHVLQLMIDQEKKTAK
ncbi:MAG: hypothetical protein QG639_331 [Patescibacteria group bacterium]|jgi:hypothetical protein|nr:hypothetical protein [Patescibacteria group bacterium]